MRAIQNEIETIRALPFDDLKSSERAEFRSRTPGIDMLTDVDARVSIKEYDGWGGRLKEVDICVRWHGEHGRVISKNLTTLVSDRRVE